MIFVEPVRRRKARVGQQDGALQGFYARKGIEHDHPKGGGQRQQGTQGKGLRLRSRNPVEYDDKPRADHAFAGLKRTAGENGKTFPFGGIVGNHADVAAASLSDGTLAGFSYSLSGLLQKHGAGMPPGQQKVGIRTVACRSFGSTNLCIYRLYDKLVAGRTLSEIPQLRLAVPAETDELEPFPH